jgi:hypothetical protein
MIMIVVCGFQEVIHGLSASVSHIHVFGQHQRFEKRGSVEAEGAQAGTKDCFLYFGLSSGACSGGRELGEQ